MDAEKPGLLHVLGDVLPVLALVAGAFSTQCAPWSALRL